MDKHSQGMQGAIPPVHGQPQKAPVGFFSQNPNKKKKDKRQRPEGVQEGEAVYCQQTTQPKQMINLDYSGNLQARQQRPREVLIDEKPHSRAKKEQRLASKELEKQRKREIKTLHANIDKLHDTLHNVCQRNSSKHIQDVRDAQKHISGLETLLQSYKDKLAGSYNDALQDHNVRPTTAPASGFGGHANPCMRQQSKEYYENPNVEHDLQSTEVTSGRPKTAPTGKPFKREDNDNYPNDFLQKENQQLKYDIQQLKDDKRIMAMKLQDAERRKEELLSRLSDIAGRKLRENNPAIADLSNENRPTKLAEKYKELYDNEWTEAFEESYKQGVRDRDAISGLLRILLDAYAFCMEKSEKQPFKLTAFEKYFDSKQQQMPRLELSREDLAKHLRNSSSKAFDSAIQNAFLERIKRKQTNFGRNLELYCRKCVEITWYMSLQIPPVVIDQEPKPGDNIKFDRYACYTANGTVVDYVVWPACMIEQDGDLLAKGVLQPIPDDKDTESLSGEKMKHAHDDDICQIPGTGDRKGKSTPPQRDEDDKSRQKTHSDEFTHVGKRNKQESCSNQHALEKKEETQGMNPRKERSYDRNIQQTTI